MKRLAGALVLVSGTALAGDPAPPPPPFSGKAELSFLSTSGNTRTQTFGLGLDLGYKTDPWDFKLKAAFVRAEADVSAPTAADPNRKESQLTAKAFDVSLRAGRKISAPLEAFVQAAYGQNRFAGIDGRIAVDAGLSFKALAGPAHFLGLEGAFGFIKEDLCGVSALFPGDCLAIDPDSRSFATARAGAVYKYVISKNAEFTNDANFTLDLKATDDWRFTDKAAVSASLTSVFSLKIGWALAYRNCTLFAANGDCDKDPAKKTISNTDTVTTAAIVAKF